MVNFCVMARAVHTTVPVLYDSTGLINAQSCQHQPTNIVSAGVGNGARSPVSDATTNGLTQILGSMGCRIQVGEDIDTSSHSWIGGGGGWPCTGFVYCRGPAMTISYQTQASKTHFCVRSDLN